MSSEAHLLLDEIERIQRVLQGIDNKYSRFKDRELAQLGRCDVTAVYVAETLDKYYTAVETLLLRVSQFFENSLSSHRWHADLLAKMTLHVSGVRERFLQDDTRELLSELMRFRHFRRYYFDLGYDWGKLEFLQSVYDRVNPLFGRDLETFRHFLQRLAEGSA